MWTLRLSLLFPAFMAGIACVPVDPITRYAFIVQWMGDTSVEQGATVCGVGRARRHIMALPHGSSLTCRPEEYAGSEQVTGAFSDPPAWVEPLAWDHEREPAPGPVRKVRGFGDWSVGLIAPYGLVVDRFVGEDRMDRAFHVPLAIGAPLADLEVDGPWAFVADGFSDLVIVSLEALPSAEAVVRLPLGGRPRDVYVDANRAVVLVDNTVVVVDITDRAAPIARGRLVLTGLTADGVGVRGDFAYVAAGGGLYTLELTDPDAPTLLDDAGVSSTVGGISLLHGDYLFQAPGFNTPLAVTQIGDPGNPNPFWAFMGGNGVFDVAAAGDTLYLANGSGGVQLWGPQRDYAEAFDE